MIGESQRVIHFLVCKTGLPVHRSTPYLALIFGEPAKQVDKRRRGLQCRM